MRIYERYIAGFLRLIKRKEVYKRKGPAQRGWEGEGEGGESKVAGSGARYAHIIMNEAGVTVITEF